MTDSSEKTLKLRDVPDSFVFVYVMYAFYILQLDRYRDVSFTDADD